MLGHTFTDDEGLIRFWKTPMSLANTSDEHGSRDVRRNDSGAVEQRTKGKKSGTSEYGAEPVYALEYTHECRGDQFGGTSCGLLTARGTLPTVAGLPEECYHEEGSGERIRAEYSRAGMRGIEEIMTGMVE